MSDFTTYVEQQVRDWMSQGTDMPVAPANLYVALHTSDPGNDPDGTTEVGAADYSRVSTAAGTDWATTGTGGPSGFENAVEITFSEATSDWGTITHVSIWDASDTTGNALAAYALNTQKTINTNDQARFKAGDLSFDIN